MNIFGSWKDTDVAAHNARVAAKRLGAGGQPITDSHTECTSRPGCQPRPARPSISTDEAKLNKTERRFLGWLRGCYHEWIGVQNITLKLADDCRYTPDFAYLGSKQLIFYEVKGFWRDDARVKIKVAARMFPWAMFVAVQWVKGQWKFEEIKP